MVEIKDLVPWFHENKILLDVVCIRSEANLADASSRQRGLDMYVVLAAAHAGRVFEPGRVDIGLAGLHRSLRLQSECSGSKIRNSVGKPVMSSPAPSF